MLRIDWKSRAGWGKRYADAAVIALNIVVLLIAMNGLAWLVLSLLPKQPSPPLAHKPAPGYVSPIVRTYGYDTIRPRYPTLSDDAFKQLMWETWSRQYAYEPYTDLTEKPFEGTYVNVDAAGFRVGQDQGPWPPAAENFNVFLFGGSNTFGYGLSDQQALGSALQQALHAARPIKVYNFGQAYYASTQERIQFERLLNQGFIPNAAIFVDGLNDFLSPSGLPINYPALAAAVLGKDPRSPTQIWLRDLASARLFRRLVSGPPANAGGESETVITDPSAGRSDTDNIDRIIQRYLGNKKLEQAAAEAFGVRTMFVWQPAPIYHHQPEQELIKHLGNHPILVKGYPVFRTYLDQNPQDAGFLWCADILERVTGVLFLDAAHYAPRTIELLTQCIQKGAETNGLLE
jgi:hypothetical protein